VAQETRQTNRSLRVFAAFMPQHRTQYFQLCSIRQLF
jgi:hypothetical protein